MFTGVKEDMMAKSHQIETINKEIKMTENKRRTMWKYWSSTVHNLKKEKEKVGLSRFELAGEKL